MMSGYGKEEAGRQRGRKKRCIMTGKVPGRTWLMLVGVAVPRATHSFA